MSGIIEKIGEKLHIGGHKDEEHKKAGDHHEEHKHEHKGDHHDDLHKHEHGGNSEHKEGLIDKIKDKIHGDHEENLENKEKKKKEKKKKEKKEKKKKDDGHCSSSSDSD